MSESWIQVVTLVATIGLVCVTVAAVAVNYFIFRAQVDPHVIVYTAHDDRRPTVLLLVIRNIGTGAAYDVHFTLSRPIPTRSWGIERPSTDQPMKEMRTGPLITGIPMLAPDEKRVITWGQYGGLNHAIGDQTVEVTIRFCGRKLMPWDEPVQYKLRSVLEVQSFDATDASSAPEVKKIQLLERTDAKIGNLARSVAGIAQVIQKPEIEAMISKARQRAADRDNVPTPSADNNKK